MGLIKLFPDQELEFCHLLKSPVYASVFAPQLGGTTILTLVAIISRLSSAVLLAVYASLTSLAWFFLSVGFMSVSMEALFRALLLFIHILFIRFIGCRLQLDFISFPCGYGIPLYECTAICLSVLL